MTENHPHEFDDLRPIDPAKETIAIGNLCALLNATPRQVAGTMRDLDLRLTEVRDGIGYLTVSDAERVAQKTEEYRKEIAAASAATAYN